MNLRNRILLLLLWAGTGLYAEVEVLTRFEPSRISLGTSARYIVEITNSGTDVLPSMEQIQALPIPQIDGITLRNGQTSSSQKTSIINGRAEYSITQKITIDAIPKRTGSFTVPGYSFSYQGEILAAPAATLTVVERSSSAGSGDDELIFLDLETPEKLYVGQTQPAQLKLYVAENLNLRGYNDFERNASGFTSTGGPPEEPIKSVEIANGRRYQVFSWPLKITPIRTGKQDLSFYFELSVIVPNQRSRRSSPFGSSLFDDFFGSAQRFNIYSQPTKIDVLPLPKEGKPKSFSGAVGQFNIAVNTDSKSTRVGEPIMLSLKLSGEGNFDRIQAPELGKAQGWRSYPPESVSETEGDQGLRGKKRFDYIFVPEKAGTLKLPEVGFSFLDPETGDYVELDSPPIKIDVAASNMTVPLASKLSADEAEVPLDPSMELTKKLSPDELMSTLDYRPEKGRSLPKGSIFTPSFYWINTGFILLISLIGSIGYRNKKHSQDENYQLLKRAKQELKSIRKKLNTSDPGDFYSSASNAIRLAAGIRAKRDLRFAVFADLKTFFQEIGLSESEIASAQNLMETTDSLRFSGRNPKVHLEDARAQLNSLLKAL